MPKGSASLEKSGIIIAKKAVGSALVMTIS